jgi:sulfur relay (sulfurtransferase) complex TusBCD TusD component (DsrE family)
MDYAQVSNRHLAKGSSLNFLFVLIAGPRSEAVHTVSSLARAAARSGHRVEVFLAGDGVVHANALARTASVTLCEADLRWRQPQPAEIAGVRRGSLRDLAQLAHSADRIMVFR